MKLQANQEIPSNPNVSFDVTTLLILPPVTVYF